MESESYTVGRYYAVPYVEAKRQQSREQAEAMGQRGKWQKETQLWPWK